MGNHARNLALFVFNYGPAGVRRFVVRRLARRSRGLAEVILPLAVRDTNLEVRLAALEVMSAQRQWRDIRLLSEALSDPHEAVRVTAAHVLGETRSVQVGSYLQSALGDRCSEVRAMAAWALAQIPTRKFSPALENMLGDKDSEVRASAAEALGRVGHAEALVPLRAMSARDPIYRIREVAGQAIEELERRTAPPEEKKRLARFELIQKLLNSHYPLAVRLRAKECLIRIKGEAMIPMLEQALNDTNDTKVHLHMVEILAALTPCRSLQNALIGCIRHPSPPVRRRAVVALGDVADKEAIFYLDGLAREADKLQHMLDLEDARLAREAIRKIHDRTSGQTERL